MWNMGTHNAGGRSTQKTQTSSQGRGRGMMIGYSPGHKSKKRARGTSRAVTVEDSPWTRAQEKSRKIARIRGKRKTKGKKAGVARRDGA